MDAVVSPFENGLGHFSTQPIPNNVTSSISASNHHHPIDQSVVANEPLTDNNFEDIFESSTTDCTDIYSELPPLNERKIGNTATFNLACYKIIQLSSANYRREEIAKLFKAKESFLVSYKIQNSSGNTIKYHFQLEMHLPIIMQKQSILNVPALKIYSKRKLLKGQKRKHLLR